MSLYNMIHGVNPLAVFLIPMLGDDHPDSYPRFRNVFAQDESAPEYDNMIHLYTRVGGGNRNCGYGEEKLYKHPNFVATFDDSEDSTYATYVFSVPDKYKDDFEIIIKKKGLTNLSKKLKDQVEKVFPKLAGKLPWQQKDEEND